MSAERLRRVAAEMREYAEAASTWEPAQWFAVDRAVYGGTAAPHQVITPLTTYDGDARHIAAWSPVVALAVADWLDSEAASFHPHGWDAARLLKALAVCDAWEAGR